MPHGALVIGPRFDSAGEFSEGLAPVSIKGRFGYIDLHGSFVIPPKYYAAAPFKDGVALVSTSKPVTPLGTGEYGLRAFARFTYVDKSGKEIRSPFSAQYVGNFSDGRAAVKPGVLLGGCGKGGYLDKKGQWAIKPQFDEVRDFSEGLAAVNRGSKCHVGGKWGYIDKDGRFIIPLQFNYAGNFRNGHACVESDDHWLLLNRKGDSQPVDKDTCLR